MLYKKVSYRKQITRQVFVVDRVKICLASSLITRQNFSQYSFYYNFSFLEYFSFSFSERIAIILVLVIKIACPRG